jgi:cell wall-associated NlpC family hydrolase
MNNADNSAASSGQRPCFSLTGAAQAPYDPRVTPYRGDLADIALAGRLFAPHYAEAVIYRCAEANVPIYAQPQESSVAVSELLLGEEFAVLDVSGATAWGYALYDHYVGYVDFAALAAPEEMPAPSHQVAVRSTLIFAEASIKSRILQQIPMGAKMAVTGVSECGKFAVSGLGYIPAAHVEPLRSAGADIATLAQQLTGAPYIWGGRCGHGLDCSGLVQLVLGQKGIAAPRDSDQQQKMLGRELSPEDGLQRGDLLFFPGHVGIMADAEHLVHANAHWMQLVTEPLADMLARFGENVPQPILARRRLG